MVDKNKKSAKRLIGLSSYDILDNHVYQVAFQYVPPHIEDSHHHDDDGSHDEGDEEDGIDDFAQEALGQSKFVLENMSTFYTQK